MYTDYRVHAARYKVARTFDLPVRRMLAKHLLGVEDYPLSVAYFCGPPTPEEGITPFADENGHGRT